MNNLDKFLRFHLWYEKLDKKIIEDVIFDHCLPSRVAIFPKADDHTDFISDTHFELHDQERKVHHILPVKELNIKTKTCKILKVTENYDQIEENLNIIRKSKQLIIPFSHYPQPVYDAAKKPVDELIQLNNFYLMLFSPKNSDKRWIVEVN